MIRHVTSQRRNRDITILDRSIVRTVFRVRTEILFTNPKIRLAPRIDMLGNHRPRILDALAGYLHSLDLPQGNVHVQERSFRQSFAENFSHGEQSKAGGVRKIKVLSGDQADRNSWYAQDGRFQSACYRA